MLWISRNEPFKRWAKASMSTSATGRFWRGHHASFDVSGT
jgi:hypothetical protein